MALAKIILLNKNNMDFFRMEYNVQKVCLANLLAHQIPPAEEVSHTFKYLLMLPK